MPKTATPQCDELSNWPLEWLRIARLDECERLSGVSEDPLRREHGDKIIRISPHCSGMRVGHALLMK
jgi:hypothetical protein